MYGKLSQEALELVYDFTRCVRPNGTAYGTGGACRKGTEEDKEEPEKQPRTRKARLSKNEKVAVEVMGDKSLKSDRKRIAEMVRRGVPADTDFILLVSEAKKKLGLRAEDTIASSIKATPVEKKKRGPAPGGMRITAKVKALSAEDLKKVLKDPRLNPNQKKIIEGLLATKSKRAEETPETKTPKATRKKKEPGESPKVEKAKEVKKSDEKAGSKVSDEKLQESYGKTLKKYKELKEQRHKLRDQGVAWDDPTVRGIAHRESQAADALTLMRQAYYAKDRDAFLKAASERNRLLRKASNKEMEAAALRKKDGIDVYSIPKGHRSVALNKEAYSLRSKANGEPTERMGAAYYGEPLKISKPKSDGGGKVDGVVPSALPRGGASKDLKDFLDGAEVVMAFKPKGFSKFVKDGIAKNAFEPGTGGVKVGRVKSYMEGRQRGEENALMIPLSAKASERPVYAALEHPDRSRSLQGGQGMMSQYGGIQVVARPSVKDRATFTIGDTLDGYSPRGLVASPVRDPANPSRVRGENRTVEVQNGGGITSSRFRIGVPALDEDRMNPVPYIEAQVFGGLKLSDVSEVRYYKGSEIPSATLKALNKAGIPVVELPPQMKSLKIESYSDIPEDLSTLTPDS